ncbi:hypothetical protein TYM08_P0373 [Marinicellulosiphila megalodicopiae]
MTKELILTIETKIRLDWSPEQISNWLLKDEATLISHESIYIHIWKDKRAGGYLYTHLRRVGKNMINAVMENQHEDILKTESVLMIGHPLLI